MGSQWPLRVVTPTVDGDVLGVLAGADAEFTVPQVHRLVGRWSEAGVRKALDRLTSQGIVLRRLAGRTGMYQLNRQHLAAPAISALAFQREELIDRIRNRLVTWKLRPDYAALFGSAARGDMRTDSDIDLFVVRPDDDLDDEPWREQVASLERDVTAWTGNDARVLEYTTGECRAGLRAEDPVLADIARDGIRLDGPPDMLRTRRTGSRGGKR